MMMFGLTAGHWLRGALVGAILCVSISLAGAQAAANTGAPAGSATEEQTHGRKLVDQMLQALGGQAWLAVTVERLEGKSGTFYKGQPNPYEAQFEEYLRLQPFGERVVIVSKQGVFIPTTKRDVAEVWTPENGYEITFRGRKELPQKDVDEFQRRRRHSLDTVVRDWLKRPGTLVSFEGSKMDERHLVDMLSILTTDNDVATLTLDQETHLPRSLAYQWRDPVYKDFNTELERFDDWHEQDGIMTPLTITRYHNGDMVGQRFLTKVQYHLTVSPDLFDPDRPLSKKLNR